MTEAVQVALIVSVAPTLAALANLWVNRKSGKKIEEIHKATNGMMEQSRKDSRQLGAAQQRADDKSDAEGTPRRPMQ